MTEQSRLDVLEARVQEQSEDWRRIDQRLDESYRDLSSRIGALDNRLSTKIDTRIDALDQRLDRRFDELRSEMWRQFRWAMGMMITLLGTMLTLGAGVMTALLRQG